MWQGHMKWNIGLIDETIIIEENPVDKMLLRIPPPREHYVKADVENGTDLTRFYHGW
jgi:hypothetical protein